MKLISEVQEWVTGAAIELGDPSEPIGQVFAKYVDDPAASDKSLVRACWLQNRLHIEFGGGWLPVPVDVGEPKIKPSGELESFGIKKVCTGFWTITPSLNMPGVIHVFAHIYDAPPRPPWESLIITPSYSVAL